MKPLRAMAAEFVGTAMLLLAVVGSGIMAQRFCGGNVGLALLVNAIATGGALVALILALGPVSGAHLNPVVTLADAARGGLPWRRVPGYVLAQFAGAIAGVAVADLMFALPTFFRRRTCATGPGFRKRDRRDVRPARRGMGCREVAPGACAVRDRSVHRRGVLVHAVDVVRESRGDACTLPHRHVRRHPPARRRAIHRCAVIGAFLATALFAWLAPATHVATDLLRDEPYVTS